MKTCKRILTLVMALLLMAAMPMTARADAWIPPDSMANLYLVSVYYDYNDCTALNYFISNYVEANLKEYQTDSSEDAVAIAGVLKHFELNAGLYPNDVSSFIGEDGKTYMKIAAGKFEDRVRQLYRREIAARDCPGYEDGHIQVSAENYGAAIRVVGIASNCSYLGDGNYKLGFRVYYIPEGVSDQYGLTCGAMDARGYQVLGEGVLTFYFGDPTRTAFRSSDFQLTYFWMNAEGIPCTNPNVPMTRPEPPTEDTTPATTEAPTEETTEVTTEPTEAATTEPNTEVTTEPSTEVTTEAPTEEVTVPTRDETGDEGGTGIVTELLIRALVALVILLALVSLAVILLLFKKKDKH